MHARNSSHDSQAKLIVRSVVKIWHKFHRNKKIATALICYARLMQCSKPVKQEKTCFLIYSSRFLDGFERLLVEATFRPPAKSLCLQGMQCMQRFKNRKIYTTLSLTNVSVYFWMTLIKGFIRQMHKQNVTKLGLQKLLFSQKMIKMGSTIQPQNRL